LNTRFDPRAHAYDHQSRHAGMVYVLMLVIALAFGGFVWQLYSEPSAPRVTAPAPPARSAVRPTIPLNPPAPMAIPGSEAPAPAEATSAETIAELGAPHLPAAPRFVAGGPYVAQLAALQSEAAVDGAWARIASRAPQLFASAQLDVERADLGQRGIYYRVRAGYFPDRDNAARFCDRIRQMGQDCIVAAR
jgi:hypothetical protein